MLIYPYGLSSPARWWWYAWPLGPLLAVSATLFILMAASASADGCIGEGSAGLDAHLFDCRAYELVSPAYKEGYLVEVEGISKNGLGVLAQSAGSISDIEDISPLGAQYEFVRGSTGWEATTALVDAPFSEFPIYGVDGISPDFQSTLVSVAMPGQYEPGEVYLRPPGDSPVPVGPLVPANGAEGLTIVGASADLRRVLFVAHSPQGRERSPLWPGDTTSDGRLPSLYEYEYNGQEAKEPQLVGVTNEEGIEEAAHKEGKNHINEAANLIGDCGSYLGSFPESEGDMYNAVSATGETVFFTAAACSEPGPAVNEIYARFGKTSAGPAHTVAISEPSEVYCKACITGSASKKNAVFQGASENGTQVFFTTEQELLPGAEGGNLYEYDFNAPSGERVSRVSIPPVGEAKVLGVVRVSEAGSHVYFVAEGVLTNEPRGGGCLSDFPHEEARCFAKQGGDNLYVYDTATGRTSFIATLSSGDGADWNSGDSRPVQATPNGDFLVFESNADLTPDQEGQQEAGQIFEYDAETDALVRVSQGREGYNKDGNSSEYAATIPVQNYEREIPVGIRRFTGLAVSSDGSRVFFSTEDALTPQTLNGIMNVYEYHDGQVGLISDGHDTALIKGQSVVELLGTDESGSDVFFTTADRLVPQDIDDQVDVYDARIEGGFAPPKLSAPCSGDSCQLSPAVPPSLLVPGVSSPTGEASVPSAPVLKAKAPAKKKPVKHKLKAKKGKRKARRRNMAKAGARRQTAATGGGR